MIEKHIEEIELDKIIISKWNVRTLDREKGIDELAESIEKYGLLQPIVVFQEGDKFSLIVGQRRFLAYKELKKKDPLKFNLIPAIKLPRNQKEEDLKVLSLSENIHRVELNRADIVEVISYLYKKYNSAKEVSKILGKSVSYIYDHLKIQDAPDEIKQMLGRKEINKEDVKRVMEIAADDKDKMINLAKKMKKLTAPQKARLPEIGKRKPLAGPDELVEEAKKPYIEEKVIVPLTPALLIALDKAVEEIGLSREEISKKAIEDWLSNKGYFMNKE